MKRNLHYGSKPLVLVGGEREISSYLQFQFHTDQGNKGWGNGGQDSEYITRLGYFSISLYFL